MREHTTSEQIREEIKRMERRSQSITRWMKEYKAKIAEWETELGTLCGRSYLDKGEIARAKSRLESALRVEADEHAVPVVFSKRAFNHSRDYVVVKVTKQRIFIREPGASSCDQFLLNGQSPTRWKGDVIDIRATFGIDADEVPPNYKPAKLESVK